MDKRKLWIFAACLMFAASIGLIIYYLWGNGYFGPTKSTGPTVAYEEFTNPSIDEEIVDKIKPSADKDGDTTESDQNGADEIECPVNFEELQATNPDIIGWIYMTSPDVSLPILRSPDDDTKYLYHDAVGEYKREGSLFVEHQYNGIDFSDPVTVIYGHRMSNGSMFGNMQATVTEDGYFDTDRYIVIFTPKEIKKYQIFATFPSDNRHILYYNDFHNKDVYDAYIGDVYSKSGSDVNLVDSARPEYGDRILVLSSCLWEDRNSRFLVLAKEI